MAVPTVVIIGADKGGVGKTTLTRAVLDFLTSQGVDFRAFDSESPEGVLKRFFPAQTEIVDMSKSDGQMQVFDTLQRTKMTVIDVRAGLLTPTLRMLADIGLLDAVRENKLKIIVLHVLGSTVASFNEIKSTAEILTGSRYFLVTNHINDTTYFGWDGPEAKQALTLGEAVIDVPKLNELAIEHVEKAGVPFNGFIENTENSLVMRGYVRHWRSKVFAALGVVKLGAE
jgi:hypothetical protein